MELNELKPAKGSVKKRKRVGRGQSSGKGGSSTRGKEGARSRSGFKERYGFEGGQMPLQKRVPKYGFRNPNPKTYSIVNLSRLQQLADLEKDLKEVGPEILLKHGMVKKNMPVKILGNGELNANLKVKAHKFSASAKKSIEAQGGETVTLER